MPAARKGNGAAGKSLVGLLNEQVPVRPVSETLALTHYYRSLHLLLAQASAYRAAKNDEQLYVMLMRHASLVLETIPKHRQHRHDSAEYRRAQAAARAAITEAEKLKQALYERDIKAPQAHTSSRPQNAVRITESAALPDINWGGSGAAAAAAAAAAGAPPADGVIAWPPSSAAPAVDRQQQQQLLQQQADGAQLQEQQQWAVSSHYVPSSAATAQKHALYAPRSQQQQQQPPPPGGTAAPRPRYPAFDASPIDALWQQQQQQPPDVGALSLQPPRPSAGPSLGPQEVEVQGMSAAHGAPGGTCARLPPSPGPAAVAEAAAAAAAGPKALSRRIDLRDVHISVALMNDFLAYAAANTRRGVESCGILAGRLSAADSRFTVTTLIVPKQTGTSDTVEMLGEEEVWEAESSRELVPLGWIHTHPTQSCFLSSVDIHTQCGYQTMLDEAVAVVMAPSDAARRCGIFRLTTPAGLGHVQRCAYRGFHAGCNSGQYELCGHVYLSPSAKHEVIDLR